MSRLKELLNLDREPIYINPYTDFGFKRLFGEEANKDLLTDFLNQILPKRHKIAVLTFQNVEQMPKLEYERKAFFDIHCKSTSGETFVVEMQKAKMAFFRDRSVFYVTFPIQTQAQKGEWDFKLAPVYFIALLDFEYDIAMKRHLILRKIALKDQFGELFSDKVHLAFIQMPLFKKKENELKTRFDKWLYFLKNLEEFSEIPKILNEPIFEKGFEIAKISKMSTQEYMQYEKSRLAVFENKAIIETALEEGRMKGKTEERELFIVNCISQGLSIEQTASLTNSTIVFVKEVMIKYKLKAKE